MATQTQFLNTVLDRLEKQISKTTLLEAEIAVQKESAEYRLKMLIEWEQRAKKAEAKLADQVDWQQAAYLLSSQLEDARLILEPLSQSSDLVEGLTYKDMAVDFVQKWGKPTDPYAGVVEYKEAVSNGR